MNRSIISFIAAAGTLSVSGVVHAQQEAFNQFFTENRCSSGRIYVGRYGYWLFQPVKMAYYTCLCSDEEKEAPKLFTLFDTRGKPVFTGELRRMTDADAVFAPVTIKYPGEAIYGLNFSSFNQPGRYYIRIGGAPSSMYFTIGGKIPEDAAPLPGFIEFEKRSGLLPPGVTPINSMNFLNGN